MRALNGSGRSVWHKSAPAAVRRAFSSDRPADGWAAWRSDISSRKRPAPLQSLPSGPTGGLDWVLSDGLAEPLAPDWLLRVDRLRETRARAEQPPSDPAIENDLLNWLGEAVGRAPGVDYALDALAACRALPRLAAVLSPEVWWALLDHLVGVATEASGAEADDRPLEDNPLLHQLLAGELALTALMVLPHVACGALFALALLGLFVRFGRVMGAATVVLAGAGAACWGMFLAVFAQVSFMVPAYGFWALALALWLGLVAGLVAVFFPER